MFWSSALARGELVDATPVLESIVFGDDPKIAAADRLRALELLQRQNPVVGAANLDLLELSSNDLDDVLDGLIGDVIARAIVEGTGWPVLTRSLQTHIERRAAELAEDWLIGQPRS